MNYHSIGKLQDIITDIHDAYMETMYIFPFNVTREDLAKYDVTLKSVTLAGRAQYLIRTIPKYWNICENCPGSEYSFELWKDILSYGFKFGNPPLEK